MCRSTVSRLVFVDVSPSPPYKDWNELLVWHHYWHDPLAEHSLLAWISQVNMEMSESYLSLVFGFPKFKIFNTRIFQTLTMTSRTVDERRCTPPAKYQYIYQKMRLSNKHHGENYQFGKYWEWPPCLILLEAGNAEFSCCFTVTSVSTNYWVHTLCL